MSGEMNRNLSASEKSTEEAAHEIQELNNYMRVLLNNAFTYCLLLDRDANIIHYSESLLSLAGITDYNAFIGMSLLDAYNILFTDKDFIERASRRLSRVLSGDKDFSEDDTVVWPNGQKRIYRVSYRQIAEKENNFNGIFIFSQDITDWRLEEEQRNLDNLLSSTVLPCIVWDENGNVVSYNSEIARIFGASEKLSPKDFNDFIVSTIETEYQPDGKKTIDLKRELVSESLEKGFSHAQVQLKDANGEPLYFAGYITRFSWLFGFRLIFYLYDMTEIKMKESKAKEAEDRVQIMFNSMPLTATLMDKNFKMVDCNQACMSLFDLSSKEEYLNGFYNLAPEYQPSGKLSKEVVIEETAKAFSDGYNHIKFTHQKPDGELIPCDITLIRMSYRDEDYVMGYALDLREINAALDEVDETNERIKLMLDSNPLMCILRDDQGNIVDCNQEALNIMGISDKTVFCENFYSYFPKYQLDGSRSVDRTVEIMQILDDKGSIHVERTFQTPAGDIIPVESEITRIPWKNTYYYLSFSRDLREEKAKEQEMRETAEKEREARLQKEAAQAADEAKSQFLANMSHEIRTPMNAVIGMSELLLQEKMNKRQMRYTRDIKSSAEALLNIINDILDISKIQAGKFGLTLVHYDFSLMIDNISSMMHFLAEEKKIVFKLFMSEQEHVYLYGDDVRLRQVLLNLLSNAIKFTDEGYVHLTVSFMDTMIKIVVSDTGRGIPEESLPTLFDAFEQADTLNKRDKKGTGLGLSIAKAIIELMDGHIMVESIYGQGSTFQIIIPMVLSDESLVHHVDSGDIAIYAPDAKILVVDDNKMNLNVARGLLQLYKIKVETATSGKQAIEMVQKYQFDIVFMDHRMPEMSGIEATKAIRDLSIGVPIIALTASAVVGAKEMMLDAGMDDYLWKPIDKSELIRILKKWIPAEKLLDPPSKTDVLTIDEDEGFWKRIEQIEGFSLQIGLDRVYGQRDVFKKSLNLMIHEIEKCDKNLNKFLAAEDMVNFSIEVHSIKGSLANIGAMELSEKARELEISSAQGDSAFCAANLPALLEELHNLNDCLVEAFSSIIQSDELTEIPPELPPIFERLIDAFGEIDLVLIDEEMENINALQLSGMIKEKIERIKDMVTMMDYDGAIEHIQKLLNSA